MPHSNMVRQHTTALRGSVLLCTFHIFKLIMIRVSAFAAKTTPQRLCNINVAIMVDAMI